MAGSTIKRVAVIGTGPAGAIALDALAQEQTFDLIRVFERREGPGGSWIGDTEPPPALTDLNALADRTADPPLPIPSRLPASAPRSTQPRFTESSIYPYLETNVSHETMSFTQEPIPEELSERTRAMHGDSSPFRHWHVIRRWLEGLMRRRGYGELVSYGTTVERAEKVDGSREWELTLRKEGAGGKDDDWWTERFDAVVVATGHYSVPYIPRIEGLDEFEKARPGSVLHSKQYRGKDQFKDKASFPLSYLPTCLPTFDLRVVVVGASVSAADISFDLVDTAEAPVHSVVLGHTANRFFGDLAFLHPGIQRRPSLARVSGRTLYFADGSSLPDVDHVIFGTGYTWTLPFLPLVSPRNNRVPGLWQHVVWLEDPTLLFVGAVNAGFTFKIFEWQAVFAARLLAGRTAVPLPDVEEMRRWEEERVRERGDGPGFTLVAPDFEEYFELLRGMAGEGEPGKGRTLPPFRREWVQAFEDGHEMRRAMWRRVNAAAAEAAAAKEASEAEAEAVAPPQEGIPRSRL